MSGYNWNAGMSNCAVAAYEDGLLPASKLAAALKERGYKVSTAFIRENFTANEWHHTSAKFNATDFYDLREVIEEIEEDPDLQAKIAEEAAKLAAARKSRETFVADVTVTDWVEERCNYRTFRYPQKRTLRSVQVTQVPGAVMIQIEEEGRRKAANCVDPTPRQRRVAPPPHAQCGDCRQAQGHHCGPQSGPRVADGVMNAPTLPADRENYKQQYAANVRRHLRHVPRQPRADRARPR